MSSTTRKRKKTVELPIAQFIAIIVLSISVFLIVDFGRRAATGYRVHQEEKRLEAEMAEAEATHTALLARYSYVQTDVYVEEIARKELKWSRPGDTVIVILATPQAGFSPPVTQKTPHRNTEFTPLQAWINLFFPEQ